MYGLVDNPPKNNPAVIKTSGMTSTIESHKINTCNPQFSIYSNYSCDNLLKVMVCFPWKKIVSKWKLFGVPNK